jgi:hypothetical protein
MKKRLSTTNTAAEKRIAEPPAGAGSASAIVKRQPGTGAVQAEQSETADGRAYVNDVTSLDVSLQGLIRRMLVDGATFEDVVDAVNERGDAGITLSAVQNYYRGSLMLQKMRTRRLVESADALLSSVSKDPKSAEAQLAKATFLTGYSRVHRGASLITPRDAERFRLERENVTLKHEILALRKKKTMQDLEYSRARTRLIFLTQAKLQEDILKLQREVTSHRPGDPIPPEVFQRIQQIYGLVSKPLLYEENANAASNA